ncbi:MAG: DUF1565 domain-containing protein [Hormoscilla sp.]
MSKKSTTPSVRRIRVNHRHQQNHNLSITRSCAWASLLALCLLPVAQAQEVPFRKNQNTGIETKYHQNQLFVNPATGNDSTGDGSSTTPLKTITQALRIAQPDTVIQLAPGTYSTETGEFFPLNLKPGVTMRGDRPTKGKDIIIRGGGYYLSPTFARQNITILGANKAAIAGVTVTNPHPRGYGLWIESSSVTVTDNTFTGNTHDGISVTGNSGGAIAGNHFVQNGANGMTIYGISGPEVRDNHFQHTGFGINIAESAAPVLIGNRITGNKDGILVQAHAIPVLRNNTITGNSRYGLVAIGQSQPNLGTANEAGGNIFDRNGELDISANSSNNIPAFGNQLSASRTSGQIDFQGITQLVSAVPTPASAQATATPLPEPDRQAVLPPPTVPPPPPPVTQAQTLRYRVVVEAATSWEQNRVRDRVPDAFRSFSRGRRVMQVGAFINLSKAEQLVQHLQNHDIVATIEPY